MPGCIGFRVWRNDRQIVGEVSLRTLSLHVSIPPSIRRIGFHALIGILVLAVGVLAYAFVMRSVLAPPVDARKDKNVPGRVIQLDLLNGCGVTGAASKVTGYLRARGFDVVEVRNYKTFDVKESLVIDRSGNVELARKVAYALGVREHNILQQLNPDYFVDVSVVIGKDYASLKPYQR